MSAPVMTRAERIASVQRLGYGRPDAEFLSLVALHGGYFVRRQFYAWIDVERGNRSEDFIADLLDRGHCRRHVFAHNRQVFPLRFRPLYRAVGGENSRNRREHQPQAVKARLMTLDFVLAHPEQLYFATEREKVVQRCGERRIDHEALPAKAFPGRDGDSSMRRCFLDRFLLFTRPGTDELAFCYIDSGFETSGPFASHLCRYLPLFAELPSFKLVYVATASMRSGQAQTVFERVLSRGRTRLTKVVDPELLLAHFRGRELFEKSQTGDFDRDRFDGLRDDMDTFSCPRFAEMFVRWRPPATKLFAPKLRRRRCPTVAACTEKAIDLDVLERPHKGVDRAPWRERSKKRPFTSVSMEAFTKDTLRNRSKRAVRPWPWRIDPCFGVKGGAGATPVSVGCAATNPPSVAPLRRGSLPPLPCGFTVSVFYANRIANRRKQRWGSQCPPAFLKSPTAGVSRSRSRLIGICCKSCSGMAANWSRAETASSAQG